MKSPTGDGSNSTQEGEQLAVGDEHVGSFGAVVKED